MKSAKTIMATSEGMGISKLCEVLASASKIGQSIAARGFGWFAGQRPCAAKKHLALGLLLVHQK
jgi:hypothetical protein